LLFNKCQLPSPFPILEPFFARNGLLRGLMDFVVDQVVYIVFFGKPFDQVVFMFPYPFDEVRGHAYVQCAIAPAGYDVHIELSFKSMNHKKSLVAGGK
jgi:hypothetical protein